MGASRVLATGWMFDRRHRDLCLVRRGLRGSVLEDAVIFGLSGDSASAFSSSVRWDTWGLDLESGLVVVHSNCLLFDSDWSWIHMISPGGHYVDLILEVERFPDRLEVECPGCGKVGIVDLADSREESKRVLWHMVECADVLGKIAGRNLAELVEGWC